MESKNSNFENKSEVKVENSNIGSRVIKRISQMFYSLIGTHAYPQIHHRGKMRKSEVL